MQERERILELVKNGVISTQEGLDLLESLVKKEDKKQEKVNLTKTISSIQNSLKQKRKKNRKGKKKINILKQIHKKQINKNILMLKKQK